MSLPSPETINGAFLPLKKCIVCNQTAKMLTLALNN